MNIRFLILGVFLVSSTLVKDEKFGLKTGDVFIKDIFPNKATFLGSL